MPRADEKIAARDRNRIVAHTSLDRLHTPMDTTLNMAFLAERSSRTLGGSARMRDMFSRNYASIWRFLRRMGVPADRADDAAQNVFLVALEALPRIADGSERSFLFSTAVRIAFASRRKFEREVLSEALDEGRSSLPTADQLADQKRAREVLDAIVDRMSVDVRSVFVLAEFEQFRVPENRRPS